MQYKCILCEYYTNKKQSLGNHIHSKHHLNSKEFYDMYIKKPNEDICPYCGKQTKFKNMFVGYNKHCSVKCSSLDPNTQIKNKQTNQIKYGYDTPLINPEVRQKMFTEEAKQKRKQHTKETFNIKYGGHPMYTEKIKNKVKQTNQSRYGGNAPSNNKQVIKKILKQVNKKSTEQECFEFLCSKYQTVIRDYKSEEYPFKCDLYIKDINMYIELHLFWMHGYHMYNPNNIDDQNKLQQWKDKNTDIYNRAIDIWTNIDILKYNIAIKNNLNYKIFYSKNEFYNFFNKEVI